MEVLSCLTGHMLKQFKRVYKAVDSAFNALTYTVGDDLAITTTYRQRDEFIILGLVAAIFTSAILTVAVLVAIIGYLIWQGRLKTVIDTVEGANYLLAFCLITFVVSLMNLNLQGVLISFVMCAMFLVSMFIRSVMTRAFFEKIIDISCVSSVLGFVVIACQKLVTIQSPEFRASSTFLNANYYGAITELVVILCLYKMLQPKQRHWQRYLAIAVMNLGGLFLSDCRSAMGALAIAVLVILLLNKRYRLFGVMLGIEALIVAAVYLAPFILPRIDQAGMAFMYRTSIWQTSIKGIMEHPLFGLGGGSYRMIFARLGGPDEMHAHSLFLDPLLNFGIVGVIFLAVYYKNNLKSIWNMLKYPQDYQRSSLMAAVLACVVIHGITDITVFSVQTGLLVSVLMGVAGIRENQPDTEVRTYAGDFWRDKGIRVPQVSAMTKGRSYISQQPPK